MTQARQSRNAQANGVRMKLLISLSLLAVFSAGLLLGRSRLAGGEAQNGAESKPASKASEQNLEANQVRLSPEAVKRGQIEIGVVSVHSFQQTLEVTGRLTINEDAAARVGTIVTGRVTRALATVGDYVKKGQALVYIHSHELLDARANAAKAQAAVTEREKALAYAKAELDRADRLLAAKAVSRREHAQAAANVIAATGGLEQARAEQARTAELLEHLPAPDDSQEDIVIYAPISGVVLKRNVTLGTVINEASDLMLIANLETLWAIADAPQQLSASVRVGQPVEINISTFGDRRFSGRVVHIGAALNPETRTAQVRCLVHNPRGILRPEMYATINIASDIGQEVLAVPGEAVNELQGERVVFAALDDGLFEKKPVRTGHERNGMIEVTSGLQNGQRIVTRGAFFIKSEFLKSTLSEE
ncbi:MAG TPA: efflux RND transporter periplasmic adaptor subunit [Blastocatellia bacterium]|nr:efflux RND transporter periplasmic adaptor subunit [Blastocatellia bacterium]